MWHQLRKHALRVHWLVVINQFLGFVLFNEMLTLWVSGFFTAHGFQERLTSLAHESHLFFVKGIMLELAHISHVAAPFVFLLFFITSLCLLFCFAKFIANWAGTIIFVAYYFAHISHKGTWLFEFLLPASFFFICAIASTHHARFLQFHHKFWGKQIYNQTTLWPLPIIFLGMSVFLSIVIFLSHNAGHYSLMVAIVSGLVYLCSNLVNLYLEQFRCPRSVLISALPYKVSRQQLRNLDKYWIDLMCMSMGLMLVCQVYMDQYLNWFTVQGYKNLMQLYAHYTSLPASIAHLLQVSTRYTHVLMPIQLAVESFLALCMVILILRFPVLLLAAGLFFILGFVELGIPEAWPPTTHAELSWTWILIAPALIALAAGIYHLALFFESKTLSAKWLGRGASFHANWRQRVFISVIVAIGIYTIVRLSPSLKDYNSIFALSSSLTVFFYLSLLNVIDIVRRH